MSGRQFFDWMAYHELEPFGEERADLRLAAVLRMLFSINRDTEKVPEVPRLAAFYGDFIQQLKGIIEPEETQPKSWQRIKAVLLEHAVHAAVAHEAQLRIEARAAGRRRA